MPLKVDDKLRRLVAEYNQMIEATNQPSRASIQAKQKQILEYQMTLNPQLRPPPPSPISMGVVRSAFAYHGSSKYETPLSTWQKKKTYGEPTKEERRKWNLP